MERKKYSQLEFFLKDDNQLSSCLPKERIHFFSYARRYEKKVIWTIFFVVWGLFSFSLGVERGKRLAVITKEIKPINLPASSTKISSQKPVVTPKEATAIEKETTAVQTENYIIQLASYRSKRLAEKEAQVLKEKGFQPIIFSKGGYIVLCVGSFSKQETAKSLLSQLKKRYQDCFIRRL
ncbi:MAG: SPOR domain-containing protein [Candidatus Omnitrophica bacterium]|nr:SPOR domain-containing protein [Candidatus Omnitrophota bacterium]